ncbi:MAG TPA: P27 family phage terminase small subunit [Jatrophihabitans sp.]|nr:P27 family phage terminase small subunit [Jatrophihabitans sp.]
MGERGALKLPAHLRPVGDDEVAGTVAETAPKEAPVKPDEVADNSALNELWDRIVPELDRAGMISPADGPTLELALRHFLLARVAADQIDGDVTVADKGHGGVKKHPAEAVFRAESDMFLRYAAQLGMTFLARARTPAAKGREGGESNPFAAPVGAAQS